ncbi:microtubule associated protein [Macrolepiota fuliginosa MF-IS2]|uniref:Microtubule associated protein n=1 Tax=Macrolepiota fuliginosa MF-IS2 TaxID=1400762 RepID=A0A9P6C781_9AGAR|nr:microtubule associated protein [Macrolepiota fuliginosa MF-IS2]
MDGPPPPEEDFSTLSIADRLAHKNWKARVSAYESLIKSFQISASDNDPVFKPYTSNPDLLKKIATDANAVAQEKGVECIISLVKFAGETAARTRDAVLPALVDKCLGSTRAGTKNNALELILQYVEVENGGAGVENILAGLSSKQPKAVAGSVLALKEVVRNFGLQIVPPPPVLKALPKIFAHSDKTVRAEGTNLTHVLYQYMGLGIESWLNDLKPVQVKELKEAFESMESEGKGKGTVKPERMTRAQAREAETQVEASDSVQEEAARAFYPEFDPRAFAEEVDIVPKMPGNFYGNFKSSKWKERKEALDELHTLLKSTPRIKEAPELGELAKSLATCIHKDVNINCVTTAANCLEELAKATMNALGRYRESVVPPLLERLKERKTNITDAIGNALDAVFQTTTLVDVLPDLEPALKNKNPQVKEGTLKFLGRCLSTSATPIPPAQIKPLAENLATLLEDGYEGARNEAATCFGTLMKMVGERPLNAVMENMADVRKAKVKEAFEKATVKCKTGPAPRAPAPPAKKPTPPKASASKLSGSTADEISLPPPKKQLGAEKLDGADALLVDELPKQPLKKPPARAGPPVTPAPAPAAKKLPPAAAGGKSKPPPPLPASSLDTFKYKHTPEDAENLAAELIPANIATDFGDANWKIRLAALEEMTSWVEREVEALDAEVVVRFIAKKGWAEKNFQVSSKIYGILTTLAQQNPLFGRSCCALCVPHLTEKLGDTKLKKPAGDALIAFAEKTSLQFVLNQAYEPLGKQKAPKVLADAVTWINTVLTEFGIAGLTLRSLIDFLKAALGNSNAQVRTSATKTLVTVKTFAGPSIKDLLEDLNSQLLNTIISEFDKVEGTPAPEPTRTSADLANIVATSSGSNAAAGGADPLDDLFPRVEIDGLLKGTTILADAKSDAWKTKKEALEGLQAILDQGSNKRLKPNMGEIGQVLKARVVDTNKAVQTLALDIVCRIATGMGKPFEKHSRLFVSPITTVLADQKAPIRAAALQALTAIAVACGGVESMVAGITTGLEAQNPLQKGTLLNWLVDWFKEHEPSSPLDIANWASPVVASLDDRNGDVRKGAHALLPTLIQCAGFDFVMQQTNSLKPASRASALPLIQAARPTGHEPTAQPLPSAAKTAPKPATSAAKKPITPPPEPNAAAPQTAVKVGTKIGGVRRKLPTTATSRPESRTDSLPETKPALGLKRPTMPAAPQASAAPGVPFVSMNADAKRLRLAKDGTRWINEGGPARKDLIELLQVQMEPHASKELVARLFSHDHNAVNDFIAGQSMIVDFYSNASGVENTEAVGLANFDLPLKYISIRVHESQSNLVSKCLDVVDAVLDFLRNINYQMSDGEALCFVPTLVHKLGDAREPVRLRVQRIFQTLPKVYPYSRVFQVLLDQGIRAKVAKTRQGTLDELANILKKSGMSACEPPKAFPLIASTLSDKDPQVRKSALNVLSEAYTLVGEKVWSLVGALSPKDKTQLEERLRRIPGPSSHDKAEPAAANPAVSRLAGGLARPASPSVAGVSRLARPTSPAIRSVSPAPSTSSRAESPVRGPRAVAPSPVPTSPSSRGRGKSLLPSRLVRPRSNLPSISTNVPREPTYQEPLDPSPSAMHQEEHEPRRYEHHDLQTPIDGTEDITLTISTILSSDPLRSVDALKKIQKILSAGPEAGPSNPSYRELAEHTEGLIESITLQMAHVFERPEELVADENFRLAKHLIQTLNNFCDHGILAESLTVDIVTSLLEELTLRLLETDDNSIKKIKDLSRFINMIILRLFATGRRMSIFRALFALLLQIVKPFPSNAILPESKEAKVAELVLKCVWKLARNIPQDLAEGHLDPVELFPAIEHFLQSVPPNEWRARATNKVPCGDMPLRTIKVIIQHVVGHYGDEVYDLLSASFDDPSATIVYPYVYRILNSGSSRIPELANPRNGHNSEPPTRSLSPVSSRPISPQESVSSRQRTSHQTSPSSSSVFSPPTEEPDPDAQLLTIIGHISSETTGALHKEGITELHHFLKAHPHKRPRVEKMLESTGAAFRKYINRALASRAAEDQERDVAVADTLSTSSSTPPVETSPRRADNSNNTAGNTDQQEKLSRLHDIFQYRSSTLSNGSSQGRTTPTTQRMSLE